MNSLARVLVRPAGLEPATYGFEVRRSIQLSYGRVVRLPFNPCLSKTLTVKDIRPAGLTPDVTDQTS
jgi:hypothetical protein